MMALKIQCEHKPSPAKLEVLQVDHWPVWEKRSAASLGIMTRLKPVMSCMGVLW